jgi:hypothetical protein
VQAKFLDSLVIWWLGVPVCAAFALDGLTH